MIHRSRGVWGHLLGLLFLMVGGGLFCALISYSAHDPSCFTIIEAVARPHVNNMLGIPGAWSAALMFVLFGAMSYLLVLALVWWGAILFARGWQGFRWGALTGFSIFFFSGLVWAAQQGFLCGGESRPGGFCGNVLERILARYIDPFFAQGMVAVALMVGIILWGGFRWVRICWNWLCYVGKRVGFARLRSSCALRWVTLYGAGLRFYERILRGFYIPWGGLLEQYFASAGDWAVEEVLAFEQVPQLGLQLHQQELERHESGIAGAGEQHVYTLPILPLPAEATHIGAREKKEFATARSRQLEEKLAFFGVTGKVVNVTVGPVVTLFEYAPDEGVKVAKIVALEDDLSLALGALSLRIMAPIPGKSVVGFEVANLVRETVTFSVLTHSAGFKRFEGALPLIMGRDVAGNDLVADLTQMPHVLVAGSTGSGKSVALHGMLMSLLISKTPDELKLLLIDPKRLEFAAYEGIPHLMTPVVTEVAKVPRLLLHVTQQMDARYSELARVGARSIDDYHRLFGREAMPYLVVVIDELADVMITVGRDVEPLIARLAQMARAAGIHLVIATQRPSVDVITGVIKVNFPSRVAFKVMSKIDSRTILDAAGAELLLGKGDMLFLNAQGRLDRLQGAYVSSHEIGVVVDHIRAQRKASYQTLEELFPPLEKPSEQEDPLLQDVLSFVKSRQEISISLIQRQFRIGYNRSARLIDTLEVQGVILPAQGSKMRKVVEER